MIIDRIGRALVAPRRALEAADRPDDAGQAPADLTALIALVFVAANLSLIVRAVYLMIAGEIGGGFSTLVSRLAYDLQRPLIALVAGAAIVFLGAGKRRSIGRDSDLACVAFMPVAALAAVLVLVETVVGRLPSVGRWAALGVALVWYAALVVLAIGQARGREVAS